ncbi:MAG: DUF3108 domain-containing protein [Gammaproteobacteria bacterium]|nr:DUF3108 domain-containing protein [Gammaproteobacteria bacterium]
MHRLHTAGWFSVLAACAGLWVSAPAHAVVPAAKPTESSNSEIVTVRPFRATYRVSAGVLSGHLVLSLEHRTGQDWVLTSVATTRGVARIFRRGELVERTVLRFTEEGVIPMEYHRDDGISGPDRNAALIFSHTDGRVYGSDREHTVDLPLDGGVIDRLSMQVRLMRDLTAGLRPEEYAVVDRGEIREMDIGYADVERIEAANRQFDTLRIDHQSRNSSRSTRLWVAKEYDYLPVRIEQKRHGNTEWLGSLQEVSWGEIPSEARKNAAKRSP